MAAEIEYCYEGSDEASENELLDQSLSLWKGWSGLQNEEFMPIPLDIHTAASIGQYDCVRNIIQRGEEDFDRKNVGGWTPLMYACYIGHDTIVHLLLEAEVNLNVKNHKGQTPLMLAACCGNESVAFFLLQAGAELEARDKKGWTALFHATYSGHQNMVRFLLEAGANAESTEPRQHYTPFMEAAAAGHEIIVQSFLQHGVNANAKAFSGDTACTLALMNGHIKIVSLIENHLAGPSLRLRADPGLNFDGDLSSSDEQYQHPRRPNAKHRTRSKGPSIREGPEALTKLIDQSRKVPVTTSLSSSTGSVPKGYMAFPGGISPTGQSEVRDRDVTSPINHRDLDSSGGRESQESADYEEVLNAFSLTGALTIKSSSCSSSSGGLAAALGLSRTNSLDSTEELASCAGGNIPQELDSQRPPRPSSDPGQRLSSSYLDDGQNTSKEEAKKSEALVKRKVTVNEDPVLIPQGGYQKQQQQTQQQPDQQQQQQQRQQQQQHWEQHQPGHQPGHQQQHQLANQQQHTQHQKQHSPVYPQQQQQHQQQQEPQQQHPRYHRQKHQHHQRHQQQHQKEKELQQEQQQQQQKPFTLFPDSSEESWSLFSDSGSKPKEPSKPPPEPTVQNPPKKQQPPDLATLLNDLGLTKYYSVFLEQDVDLQVFLSLTDSDLKEIGIKLFGPRRKMTNAIARWHSETWSVTDPLEKVYADRLEAEMQEMAIQLHQAYEQVEQLKQQVLQERELRSVTEGCLMEERRVWQHVQRLAVDTRQRSVHCQQTLGYIRLLHEELCRRFGTRAELSHSGNSDSLALALRESFSLEGNSVDPTNLAEINRLTNQDILRKLLRCREEIYGSVTMSLLNSDKLLGRDVEFPPKRVEKFS